MVAESIDSRKLKSLVLVKCLSLIERDLVFTGLIEEQGVVLSIEHRPSTARLRIKGPATARDVAVGDSIAINGCCLTIVEFDQQALAFDAIEETLSRTNLGELNVGAVVNLERSMRPTDRIGGHYVTGHIDSVGTIASIEDHDDWRKFWFDVTPTLTRQMASKGSVAVDGISLTLVDVTESEFSVALIPHTLKVTTMGNRQIGDRVNIETDLLAKYVQRQLEYLGQRSP